MKPETTRWKAAAVSAGLSALFLVIYGGCNSIAAYRARAGSLYFEWERNIPFVPLLIPAYLSLDLFFLGAPFLCLTRSELRAYSFRIATAILIAGVCFLVFPLRFGFGRPEANGILGFLFDRFRDLDAPYNLVPSLHAALLLLVADVYVRRLRGFLRYAVIAWFVLIGLSPILTYQHHVIDIATGFVLAGYCFYFFPNRRHHSASAWSIRLGCYYSGGAFVVGGAALLLGGWWFLLLWPAVALAIVAAGYWWFGPGIYRKTDGTDGALPWSARFVLAPCLLGQHLSRIYYRRQCRPSDRVTPQVWIGGKLREAEAEKALRAGVTAVLDLTAEFSEAAAFQGIVYRSIPVLDLTAPTQQQLHEMGEFISAHARQGIVYVHCKIGYSRSAAAAAAYLLMSRTAGNTNEAFDLIRRVRPSVVIRDEVVSAVREFERFCHSRDTDDLRMIGSRRNTSKKDTATKHTKYAKTAGAA